MTRAIRPEVFVLAAVLAMGGCGGARPGPPAPVVSPTGVTFPPGTPPAETRYSQPAALYLRSGRTEEAARLARKGVEADPANPVHHYLAGVAHARLGAYGEAHERFLEAERLYPAYALEIEPEREAAWTEAFNRGVEAYAAGDEEGAIRAWREAATIFDLRPEAHANLARLLEERDRHDEAIDLYRRAVDGLGRRPLTRVLGEAELAAREVERRALESALADVLLAAGRFAEAEPLLRRRLEGDPADIRAERALAAALAGQGRHGEAGEIYDALLSRPGLPPGELFDLGVALFNAGEFARAAEAFGALTAARPASRDVWFNYANALFAAEDWRGLLVAGERLLALDPLGRDAGMIVARAHLEEGDEEAALGGLARIEALPVFVEGLVMRPGPAGTSVRGRVTGNRSEEGEPVRLRFTFVGDAGELGSETVTLPAPPAGETELFEVTFGMGATSYHYALLGTGSS